MRLGPLPETLRIPLIVVEPLTLSCVAAKEVEVPFVVVKFVENKLLAVSAVELAYGNCDAATVELEKKTPWLQMEVVVADVVVANVEAIENEKEFWSVAQP